MPPGRSDAGNDRLLRDEFVNTYSIEKDWVSHVSKLLGTRTTGSAGHHGTHMPMADTHTPAAPTAPADDASARLGIPSQVGTMRLPRKRNPDVRPLLGLRSVTKLQAWMLVLPVDVLALCIPVIWAPGSYKAFLSMAALSLLLLTGGGRYRARLHVSVLDELPVLLSRLFAAGAVIATVFAVRHEEIAITVFLESALIGMIALIIGRILTSQIILLGRRRRIVAHRTVIVGGGAKALGN